MGKSGPKLPEAKAEKIRKAIRALIKQNKDLQAAVNAQKKNSKSKDNKVKLRSAISRVIVRNPLLQQAAKDIFRKMK
jgi:mRNA-degrading endonuclease RelE of RelBE toxin-antitoxin system